jgi:hypothetical protein
MILTCVWVCVCVCVCAACVSATCCGVIPTRTSRAGVRTTAVCPSHSAATWWPSSLRSTTSTSSVGRTKSSRTDTSSSQSAGLSRSSQRRTTYEHKHFRGVGVCVCSGAGILLTAAVALFVVQCGEFDNAGAMMSVDETLMCSFQILKPAEKKAPGGMVKMGGK